MVPSDPHSRAGGENEDATHGTTSASAGGACRRETGADDPCGAGAFRKTRMVCAVCHMFLAKSALFGRQVNAGGSVLDHVRPM
jgi:hypothetical protein